MPRTAFVTLAWLAATIPWFNGCTEKSPTHGEASPSSAMSSAEQTGAVTELLASLKQEVASLKRTQVQLTQSVQAMEAELARVRAATPRGSLRDVVQEEIAAAERVFDATVTEDDQLAVAMEELAQQLEPECGELPWSQPIAPTPVALVHATLPGGP